ncbi:MAG TPA: sulfite exporter TauE/SafE family protein [Polyangiaceae bacterium]|nr:sulfite exporter TauE/SafE family protein [Polyangiaceae bacterium]
MAGGGSLLTLPALILIGLPADVANGTNRLSIVTQSASGVWLFHRSGKLRWGSVGGVVLPTLLGSAIGALVASRVAAAVLEPVLLATLVTVALLTAFAPNIVAPEGEEARSVGWRGGLGLFGAGLYGGFIQAGVGFVLLGVLGGLLRYDLVRANALKLVCTAIFGVVALGIFVSAGQVSWIPAVVLAAATVVGSQLGVRFALEVETRVLRRIVLVAVLASCVAALFRRA